MPSRPEQSNPAQVEAPLAIWAYAGGFAVAFMLLLAMFLSQGGPPSDAFFRYNAARVKALEGAIRGGATGIVIMGDSRIRYAMGSDPAMSARFGNALGKPVRVVKLTNIWAIFDDYARLAPLIVKARPALVIFQQSLLSKERGQEAALLVGRTYVIWKLFGAGEWNPGNIDQAALQHDNRCEILGPDSVALRRQRVYRWVSYDPDGGNARRAAAFIRALRRAGAKVLVVDVPVTSAARKGLPPVPAPKRHVMIRYPGTINDAKYCDLVHLNPDGRKIYAAWLTRIARAHLVASSK